MHVNTLLGIGYEGISSGDTFFNPISYSVFDLHSDKQVPHRSYIDWNSVESNYANAIDLSIASNSFVIPSGVSRVKLSAKVVMEHPGDVSIYSEFVKIPYEVVIGTGRHTWATSGPFDDNGLRLTTSVIDVTAGERYALRILRSDGGTYTIRKGSWMMLEVIA